MHEEAPRCEHGYRRIEDVDNLHGFVDFGMRCHADVDAVVGQGVGNRVGDISVFSAFGKHGCGIIGEFGRNLPQAAYGETLREIALQNVGGPEYIVDDDSEEAVELWHTAAERCGDVGCHRHTSYVDAIVGSEECVEAAFRNLARSGLVCLHGLRHGLLSLEIDLRQMCRPVVGQYGAVIPHEGEVLGECFVRLAHCQPPV